MAIQIKTTQYEFAHGRKPRGTGQWYFGHWYHSGDDYAYRLVVTPEPMSLTEAKAWLRRMVRREASDPYATWQVEP